jgi:hypothetical protein
VGQYAGLWRREKVERRVMEGGYGEDGEELWWRRGTDVEVKEDDDGYGGGRSESVE